MTKQQKRQHAARMESLKNSKLINAAHAKFDEADKQAVKKLNAKNFFIELVHSLAPGKNLTPTQRSQYKRVLAFLEA